MRPVWDDADDPGRDFLLISSVQPDTSTGANPSRAGRDDAGDP
jgi:hypothetical protein